ncbi:MAG TPA: GNAT family N-acetyltransferase [Pyrinomonadaceae bacterium]|jgi:GNAT superfamily N-acetyltransferase
MNFQITYEDDAKPEDIQILSDGIKNYSAAKVAGGARRDLTFFLRAAEGSIVGGVHGNSGDWGWLYISTLWVSETVRGGGYGTALMREAEREALGRGCRSIYLDTFSFQAVGFYLKLGYRIFGELEDFPPGHKRVFLQKTLT